ncbi:MAG: EAL domain-containing protein [Chromatiaceae bacterium]|nr:EAL domain-containing protein [Chromatiaceae bacterium]
MTKAPAVLRRRRWGWALASAWLLAALMALGLFWVEHAKSVQALLERNLSTLAISWQAIQALQRNTVVTYFEEYVEQPRTMALLQAAQDPAQIDAARLQLFRHLSPAYARMVERGLRQFHFHRPNGDSFLRFHHPARFGDNLLAVRASIRIANTELEPVFGFEVGRVVSGYRSLFPIIDEQGRHLGSVEFSLPFKTLLEELQALMPRHAFQLLLHQQRQRDILFDEQQGLYAAWPASAAFLIEDPHRLRADSPPPLPAAIEPLIARLGERPALIERLRQGQPQAFRLRADHRHHYAVLAIPVRDPGEAEVGMLVAYVVEPGLSALDQALLVRVIGTWLALLVVALVLFFLLRALDEKLSERHRLKVIADTLGQGLYLTDAEHRIVTANPYAQDLLGYSDRDLVGQSPHELFHHHENKESAGMAVGGAEPPCPIIQKLRAGQEYRKETAFRRADGDCFEVLVVARPLMQNGSFAGAVTLFENIHERKQAEARLQLAASVFEHTHEGIVITDAQAKIIDVNAAFTRITGYPREDVLGRNPHLLNSGRHPKAFYQQMWQILQTQGRWSGEIWNRRQNGAEYAELLTISTVYDAAGQIQRYIAVFLDISAQKKHRQAIDAISQTIAAEYSVESILATTCKHLGEALGADRALVYDIDFKQQLIIGLHEWLNPAHPNMPSSIGRYPLATFRSGVTYIRQQRTWLVSHADAIHPALSADGSAAILHERMHIGSLFWYPFSLREDGYHLLVFNWLNPQPVPDEHQLGFITSAAGLAELALNKIRMLEQHQQQLQQIAHFDSLTGLPNRVLLIDRLRQAMAQTSRRGERMAVVYLDLDGFKAVNDTHGHAAGDRLLIGVAKRLTGVLREGDLLARLGGDEFAVVFMDVPPLEASLPLLQQLLLAAAEPHHEQGLQLQVSASLGACLYPQTEPVDADQLLRQADQAMYQAKLTGKNRYHLFDDAYDRQLRERHEGRECIRHALARQEFVLYYQPKVDMRDGRVIGAEALIRWQHPERGVLPPGVFLPLIANDPLIVALGDWVIEAALAQVSAWRAAGLVLPVSVNVDALQLAQADFIAKLSAALARYPQAHPSDLELEVLETSALEDIVAVTKTLRAVQALGLSLALDDFGTGYSSLSYLKRLPVETIKIDQSFVRDMLDDPDDLAILEGIISLAAAFRRQVLAEGVETAAHSERLLQLGCTLGQGYAIARPMPADDISSWCATRRVGPA